MINFAKQRKEQTIYSMRIDQQFTPKQYIFVIWDIMPFYHAMFHPLPYILSKIIKLKNLLKLVREEYTHMSSHTLHSFTLSKMSY